MKKPNKYNELILHRKREKKRRRRGRLNKSFKGTFSIYENEQKIRLQIDRKIWREYNSPLYDFFVKKQFITEEEDSSSHIVMPDDYSFCSNYELAIETIRKIIAAIFHNKGKEIVFDFSNCTFVDQPALFVLQIIRLDFQEEFQKLDSRMRVLSSIITYKVVHSKVEKVNKLLFVTGFVPQVDLKIEGLMPLTTIGYYKGNRSQKHYSENRKGVIGTRIVAYINQCLSAHGYTFNADGINYLDGLVSEILNNAEDHSAFNTYYATANLLGELKSNGTDSVVGEMNLSFMNFGDSFFEGFEETKLKNTDVYNQMDTLYKQVTASKFRNPFSKENLFTLYALQEGMSRLKFEEESRGTGTTKFINSFFAFGDYEDDERDYHPILVLLSGATQLICDNKYKPFERDGVFFVSLNSEKTLGKPPEKSNLKTLGYYFPGTVLTARIYLNQDHLKRKFK